MKLLDFISSNFHCSLSGLWLIFPLMGSVQPRNKQQNGQSPSKVSLLHGFTFCTHFSMSTLQQVCEVLQVVVLA
jgi:hypothetical protein